MTTSRATAEAGAAAPNHAPNRYFEDLEVGETTVSSPLEVTAEEIVAFAARYDPQFFHVDPEAAGRSLFGGLVASGIHTCALWRIMDHEVNGDIAFVCGVGWEEVAWPCAVRPGDVLRARSRLLSTRPSRSRPGIGIAVFRHEVVNQEDAVVLSFTSTDLVYRRPA